MFAFKTFRALGLAAVLAGAGLAHGAMAAEGSSPKEGASAYGAYDSAERGLLGPRHPVTTRDAGRAALNLLEASGATGGAGQHQ
ncbi:hypothetical protein [Roseomonas indoligenes]|uniref:DUF4148 domain-containing protein n=1 Tax=Roseomonas indoligenes TaxID=2820811 RepID=A0A940MTH7_9PROT|nr:hypothetical protein [Pararoseomonas indoligenes]MBP0493833.1 hypothetical protein [Pararoseomonas indoligenes]